MRNSFDALRSIKRHVAQALGPGWEVRTDNEQGVAKPPFALVRKIGPRGLVRRGAEQIGGHSQIISTTMTVRIACYPGPQSSVEAAEAAAFDVEETLIEAFVVEGAGDMSAPPNPTVQAVAGGTLTGARAYRVTARAWRGESLPSASVSVTPNTQAVRVTWPPLPGARGYNVYRDGNLIGYSPPATNPGFLDYGITANVNHPVPVVTSAVVGAPGRIPLYDYEGIGLDDPATDLLSRPQPGDYMHVLDATTTQLEEPDEPRQVAVIINLRVSWDRIGGLPVSRKIVKAATIEQQPS